ncbi:MAG: ketoacyl-ACP synthase III [Planctomycetaceae bacterium]|nr:ketoacyl-ACP synthase III [Planctomycetaceae bacterium]
MISAQIFGIDYYLPSKTLINEELSTIYTGWTQEKIARKLGIEQRLIAAENETALDMGVKAAQKLFDRKICSPEEIDFLVFCTQSPDYFLPTSACIMQHQLNLPHHAGAFDYNLGCSGYIYGLAICKGLIETGAAQNVLLVTSETYSKYINSNDRSTRPLFGDGAAATLLRGVETEKNAEPMIGPFLFGTNGSGANMLIVPAGGHRFPKSPETAIETADSRGNIRSQDQLYMNGQGIFAFAIEEVPRLVNNLLEKTAKTRGDIDCYIFHQANRYMLERLQELCKLNGYNYFNDIRTVGNTVSSSVPIAMVQAAEQELLHAGDSAMLIGFGVGLSWGGTLVRLPKSLVRT